MSKRILSLLLVLALLLPVVPQPAGAEELWPVVVPIETWRAYPAEAYSFGNDLYFSEDTFADMAQYYEYYNDGKTVTYTRGCKVIEINLKTATFKVFFDGNFPFSKPLELPMENIGGTWYFSASTLLPWLNVTVAEEDGTLVVVPDEYSFWDIYAQLDLADYSVSYGDIAMEYAWNSKVLKAMKYFSNSTGQTLKEKLGFEDEYGGSTEDYFDILESYLLDTAHTEYAADVLFDAWNTCRDFIEIFSLDYSGIMKFFEILDAFDEGIIFASHFYAFTLHHADRMQTISQILLHRRTDRYTPHLAEGALFAKNTYTNWWQGMLNTYVLNLDEALAGKLMDKVTGKLANNPLGKAVLLALDIGTKEIRDLNRRIDLMAPLYNLYLTGREVYESGNGEDISGLIDLRCHAVLSLFAAAENCRTLTTYSKKHDLDDLAKKYSRMAEECDHWINMLNACALSQVNDSINYRNGSSWETSKRRYSYDLEDIFETLRIYEPPEEVLEPVEYGIFLAYAQELPLARSSWKLSNNENNQMMFFYGTIEYDGELRSFEHILDTDGLCSQFDAYTKTLPELECPALTDHRITGDTEKLMDSLDYYMSGRKNYLCSFSHDLNSDGKTDVLYVIPEAVSLWLDTADIHSSEKDFGEYVLTRDLMDTLVLAETEKDGIHIRIMRISPSSHYDLSPEGVLTTAASTFIYQPEGMPFSEDNNYLLDYCTATYADIYEEFQYASYTNPGIYGDESNVWNCTCMIGQGLSLVFDFASDYEDPSAMPIYASIDDLMYWSGSTTGAELCPGLAMGMTYEEAARTIDLTSLEWAPEQTWTETIYLSYGGAAGCALELYFIGSSEDTAVLVSVNVTPIG